MKAIKVTIPRERINDEIINYLDKHYEGERQKSYEARFNFNGKYDVLVPFEIENAGHTKIKFKNSWVSIENKPNHDTKIIRYDNNLNKKFTSLDERFYQFIDEWEKNNYIDGHNYYDIDSMKGGRDYE